MVSSELKSPEVVPQPSPIDTELDASPNPSRRDQAESQAGSGLAIDSAAQSAAASDVRPTLRQELEIFLSTFITIFLAELGDKTQVTTLLMSAQSRSPWVVFVGAGMALVLTSLLGVLVGRWLADRVCPRLLETATGALLLLIAVLLLWDVVQL